MGQKINPIGLRVGVIFNWRSRWFVKGRQFADNIQEDHHLRTYIKKKLKGAGVSKIEIEANGQSCQIDHLHFPPGSCDRKKGSGH